MDCDLDEVRSSDIRAHLAICQECSAVCEDIASLVDVCRTEASDDLVPPNSQALWCRINNIIESEVAPELASRPEPPKKRFWQLSFPQLASALVAIAASTLCIRWASTKGPFLTERAMTYSPLTFYLRPRR